MNILGGDGFYWVLFLCISHAFFMLIDAQRNLGSCSDNVKIGFPVLEQAFKKSLFPAQNPIQES